MKEQFVTYEIALKLKELGFNGECFGYYTPMKDWMMKGKYSDGQLHFHGPNWANSDNTFYFMYKQNSFGDRSAVLKNSEFTKAIHNIAVPLWQQVIDWFRDNYNIHIEIQSPDYPNESNYNWSIHILCKFGSYGDGSVNNYYEAREQSILKAIELCKK